MSARQQEIERIFSAAIERPDPATRNAYVDEACGSDTDLRSRVEALLDAHDTAGSFLEPIVLDPSETVESGRRDARAAEVLGKRIGRYKIIERIGEGGFGIVYMAEQDEPVRRKVALKIIKLGMDTKQVIARFEAERQALAMMDHPHIAKVLDAGATETGRPYFVMELVKGVPITQYCDNNRLTTRQRLELFLAVCHAVQHAHHKGIIHRDIKPSNVLVTMHDTQAVPKIIDFGIAKATSHRLTEKTLFTGFREFIGTPEYMSPDQLSISGMDVDSRTDIYSLGVLLYELLTSKTPFEAKTLRSASYEEIQRMIREFDPPKPSTRLTMLSEDLPTIALHRRAEPSSLGRVLRGDLDWIVMKAMEKDRARRYQTANELANDLERHISHEPVQAGPPGMAYKFNKFIRRNRAVVIAGTVVGLAMLAGLSAASIGLVQATRAKHALQVQRDAAQTARVEAEQAQLREQEHRQLAEASAHQALREASKSLAVNQFLQSMLGSVDPSRALGREVSVHYILSEAARELDRGALAEQPEVEATVRMTLGRTYEALGVYDGAEDHLRTAAEIRKQVLGDQHPDTLRSRSSLAGLLCSRSKYADAESLARQILGAQRRILGDDHPDTLTTMNFLGIALSGQEKLSESETLHRQALTMQQRVLGPEHIDTLRSKVNLGSVLLEQGEHAQAESLLRQAWEVDRRVLGEEHPETLTAQNGLALALERQGKNGRAEELYRQTWELNSRILGPDHPRTQIPMYNLLRVLRTQGKWEDIRPLVAQRLEALEQIAEEPGADALALHLYALELVTCEPEDMRDPVAALSYAQRAVQLDGGRDASILDTLALIYRLNGDLDGAIETQRLAIARARIGGPHNLGEYESRLSEYLLEKGDILGAAGVSFEDLAVQLGRSLTADARLGELARRAGTLMEEGDFSAAEQLLRACAATRQKDLPPGHWLIAETMSLLGEAVAARGNYAEAEWLLIDGYDGIKLSPQVPADRKRAALHRLIDLYEAWDKPDQARTWREQLEGPADASTASS